MIRKNHGELPNSAITKQATDVIRRRYDRIAPIYDLMEYGMEFFMRRFRKLLWEEVHGNHILEIGVGTGKNIPYYPCGELVTAIDLSPKMLAKAEKRLKKLERGVVLREADVQALPFPDNTFDVAVTSCVFCSVPIPVLGLREVKRVLKPGGKLFMLEHVLSEKKGLRQFMNLVDPALHLLWGAHINRETVKNVESAGVIVRNVRNLFFDIVKIIYCDVPVTEKKGRNES